MGFQRKWLDGILTNEDMSAKEKANAIMDEHLSQMGEVKDERDNLKKQVTEAETKAADLQKQLDGVNGGEDYKKKYEDEHKAFEDFKKQTASEAELSKIMAAHRRLLIDEGISEKRIDAIQKVTDFSKMKLDKDGNLDGAADIRKSIAEEWGDFKVTVTEKGAAVANPPKTGKPTKTKEEILAIKDTAERQAAIAENHELFGI